MRLASSIRELARRRLARLRLALTLLVALLVAFGASAPAYAKLVFGPADHVCHCEARGGHATCGCPICFPELADDDDGPAHGLPSVKGHCGDDEAGVRTLGQPAVMPASISVVGVVGLTAHLPPAPRAGPAPVLAPDPRPPRLLRAV